MFWESLIYFVINCKKKSNKDSTNVLDIWSNSGYIVCFISKNLTIRYVCPISESLEIVRYSQTNGDHCWDDIFTSWNNSKNNVAHWLVYDKAGTVKF